MLPMNLYSKIKVAFCICLHTVHSNNCFKKSKEKLLSKRYFYEIKDFIKISTREELFENELENELEK